MFVERVVVISLERRGERRDRFWSELPKDWPLPIPQEFMAVDGAKEELPAPWRAAGAGAYGCYLSHQLVLLDAVCDKVSSILVLEDDARFVPDFAERWDAFFGSVRGDWRMIMLGGQHVSPPWKLRPGVVRCLDTQRTHAYLVRSEGISAMLRAIGSTTGHIDRGLHRVQQEVPTYAPSPFLVGQAEGFSDVTLHEESERWWA